MLLASGAGAGAAAVDSSAGVGAETRGSVVGDADVPWVGAGEAWSWADMGAGDASKGVKVDVAVALFEADAGLGWRDVVAGVCAMGVGSMRRVLKRRVSAPASAVGDDGCTCKASGACVSRPTCASSTAIATANSTQRRTGGLAREAEGIRGADMATRILPLRR